MLPGLSVLSVFATYNKYVLLVVLAQDIECEHGVTRLEGE